jgi:hypothetical protein
MTTHEVFPPYRARLSDAQGVDPRTPKKVTFSSDPPGRGAVAAHRLTGPPGCGETMNSK